MHSFQRSPVETLCIELRAGGLDSAAALAALPVIIEVGREQAQCMTTIRSIGVHSIGLGVRCSHQNTATTSHTKTPRHTKIR
jgi:hypothetical protein